MKFFKNLLIESLIENVACKYLPALTSAITVISQIKRDIYLIHVRDGEGEVLRIQQPLHFMQYSLINWIVS